jgi:hypothetical protein
MKPVCKKLLFSAALTLALGETAVRLYGAFHPSLLTSHPSRYRRFKARPGDLSYGFPINADGFKDRPFTVARAPGEYRVAALGDSFVFSMVPYEHSFCTLIESRHANVNVLNFGVIGTAPQDYITVLQRDAIRYAPDAVILFLYAGNDFLPAERKGYEYSALATFAHHSIKAARSYKGQDIRQNYAYTDDMTPFTHADFLGTAARYARTYLMDDRRFRKDFDRVLSNLDAMRHLYERRGIRFHVVALPDRLQLEPALRAKVAEALGVPESAFALLRPQQALAEALGARRVSFLDLYPPFAGDAQRKFIHNDIHLYLHGNALVASCLPADWFRKEGHTP